jgi:hypothetical protein
LSRGYTIHGKIHRCHTGASHLIDELFIHEIPICGKVHEEAIVSPVPDYFKNEILAEKRLPAHEGDDPAANRLEPIDGAFGYIEVHAGSAVIELEAVVAVDVALPLGIEIAEHGPEIAVVDAGVKVRDDPAPHRSAAVSNLVG